MGLLMLTQSVMVTGMVTVVFPRDLHLLVGGFEVDTFILVVFVLHKKLSFGCTSLPVLGTVFDCHR